MRVEVQLNRVNRVTLLAQSFIVVEPPIDEREELAGGSLTRVDAGQLAGFASLSSSNSSITSNAATSTVSPLTLVGARSAVVQSWFDHVFAESALTQMGCATPTRHLHLDPSACMTIRSTATSRVHLRAGWHRESRPRARRRCGGCSELWPKSFHPATCKA